ncbi:hypothetical protein [Nonomuraea longicatena]|uniref:WD40 repeat domain-containing protein n=1 Tax=Nonomuraea longicatena TaxID=83682 RepID=A0ABP4AXT6_9ACTN
MTGLREALRDLADQAPTADLADLAEVAVTGHRRRRLGVTVLGAALAVTTLAAVAVLQGVRGAEGAETAESADRRQRTPEPDPLPERGAGPVSFAYLRECDFDGETRERDCSKTGWRVVTAAGRVYSVPGAMARTADHGSVPLAISRDGRKIAYYSREAGAHVVRDLGSGAVTTSPVRIPEKRIGRPGGTLTLSDDGRHLAFDPREGSKEPGLLIDVTNGKTVQLHRKYEPVAIKDGIVSLVRYVKTDLWLMPVTGGGKPVRFPGAYIGFSELAPDGRTVAAVLHKDYLRAGPRLLTLLDTKTGKVVRKVALRASGWARGAFVQVVRWQSATEVVIDVGKGPELYSADLRTGRTKKIVTRGPTSQMATLPGQPSSG